MSIINVIIIIRSMKCEFVCFPAESPAIVPDSMSPTGEIFPNQSYWSMSIEFDKQVNSIDQNKYNVESSARAHADTGGGSERQRERAAFKYHYNIICITIQFTRPLQDKFIRIFDEGGEEIISINAATSSDVIYPSNNTLGRTLIFSTDYCFPENGKFYILLDQGKRT